MNLDNLYTKKQQDVLRFYVNTDFFMLINHGAKRTGKTILDNDLFLMELKRVRKIADMDGVKLPQYILAAADLGAMKRNVLSELENKYGFEFHLDIHNRFQLFGVQVCCFGHSKTNDLGRIRGMTAYGAYINEGTIANQDVFNEIKSRCSGYGARLLIDTNSDQPEHWLKKEYIDKADGKYIHQVQYCLDDNTFLNQRYIDSIKSTTPSGMFYDRDILGLWTVGEGAVYQDFDQSVHYVQSVDDVNFVRYIAGVDWGYEHYGAIIVIGIDAQDNYYLLHETARRHEEIDFWEDTAKALAKKYGRRMPFFCDTARPEYIYRLTRAGLNAQGADKSILSGVEAVAKRIKNRSFYVLESAVKRFKEEIYMYVWDEKSGLPVKQYDDVLDAVRYAVYTDSWGPRFE